MSAVGEGWAARALRRVFLGPAAFYRHDKGWIFGHHLLAIHHTGRRTGQQHIAVVEVVHRDPVHDEYVIMVAFGRRCDWYRNIVDRQPALVQVGRRSFVPTFRELTASDAAALLLDYEERRWWWGPALPWLMARLLGEPYDATPEGRVRVLRDRPMLAFSPVTRGAR